MASPGESSRKTTEIDTIPAETIETVRVRPKTRPDSASSTPPSTSPSGQQIHGTPEVIDATGDDAGTSQDTAKRERRNIAQRFVFAERLDREKGFFRYLRTKEFWIVLVLGQILSLCITSTNTFSSLLAEVGTSIPAFQTFFNYVLLNIIYTTYTLYRYKPKGWWDIVKPWGMGWKYFLLAFCDVEGNYFTVLAYRCKYISARHHTLPVEKVLVFSYPHRHHHPLSATHQLLGYRRRRHNILDFPPRPLQALPVRRHPDLHRRHGHPPRFGPHHRRQRRPCSGPTQRRPLRPPRRLILRPGQRCRGVLRIEAPLV